MKLWVMPLGEKQTGFENGVGVVPRSLRCAARRAKMRRGRESRAASVGMTVRGVAPRESGQSGHYYAQLTVLPNSVDLAEMGSSPS